MFLALPPVVIGDVELGEESSIWFNAVIRGDVAAIRIGHRSNVQDSAVLHVDTGTPCIVGDEVNNGHTAVANATTVTDGVTMGMDVNISSHSSVGEGAIVAAAALVAVDAVVASGGLAMGVPARERRLLSDDGHPASRHNARGYFPNASKSRAALAGTGGI